MESKTEEQNNLDNKESDKKDNKDTEVNISEDKSELIKKLENEIQEYKDRYLRKVAEFENFRRRKDNELMEFFKYSNEDLIKDLLPVLDDFERSLAFIDDEKNFKNLSEGFSLIYNKLVKILSGYGLEQIESVNKPFDVHFHDAVMQIDRPDLPPHTVVDEVQKGYILKDKIIRHAKVLVSSDNSGLGNSETDNKSEEKK